MKDETICEHLRNLWINKEGWGSSIAPTTLPATGDWKLGKSICRSHVFRKLCTRSPDEIICDYTDIPPGA
ncbi:hypothetical protein [Candidatus Thiosymbion oneisti]|uniref:hypothetical protein n=1 Tax=Candidatus Thiosymbion oneisti TaxID=589554 RepID=UPI00105FA165|nr:hypothetical protein [Candidatus Thiosymbion oneisti]